MDVLHRTAALVVVTLLFLEDVELVKISTAIVSPVILLSVWDVRRIMP